MEEFPLYCFHCKMLGHSKEVDVGPSVQEGADATVIGNPTNELVDADHNEEVVNNDVICDNGNIDVVSPLLNVVGHEALNDLELSDVAFQCDGGFISPIVVPKLSDCVQLNNSSEVGFCGLALSLVEEVEVGECGEVSGTSSMGPLAWHDRPPSPTGEMVDEFDDLGDDQAESFRELYGIDCCLHVDASLFELIRIAGAAFGGLTVLWITSLEAEFGGFFPSHQHNPNSAYASIGLNRLRVCGEIHSSADKNFLPLMNPNLLICEDTKF
ncbi:hypothetical protein IEQ34_000665 [Dendrobium chrysotoxum]|uniref:Uncharacterized protein n=1 Tax=Dendrobium chrysotoxum TaxID=161865 RepID=A0AAV7HTL1_DENCH|nr:hypothetical protein IEQ34_000665 [Dendrobium chrysotoxum]